MKITFNGMEFDTDKPICVLGFKITDSWFHFSDAPISDDRHMIKEHGAKVKKFYVQELWFKLVDGINEITDIKLVTAKRDDSIRVDKYCILGHSPQECLREYKAICGDEENEK